MGGKSAHPMWWQTLPTMLVLTAIGPASDGALCPARCRCNDDALQASCASANLQVVPIQLNPEVRHIDLSNNKITNVLFTLSFYNNLLTLNLSGNKIKTLGSTNFEAQKYLKHLNLSNNEIEKIFKDSFKGLRAVTTLDLSHNYLKELNWESFRELHSLHTLKLSDNRLSYLEDGLFKSTKHLKELFLDSNFFMEIPTGALSDTLNLNYLSLSSNLLKFIEQNEMPNLPEIHTLLLDKNVITEIHQSALSGLSSLEHLDLSDNNFTTVPTASLAKLANITQLKLSGNFISTIPPVAFRGLFHLKYLRLDSLELLQWIDPRAFVDNINLEKVCLDDNIAVDRLPTRLFHGNPRVIYLSVRNNRLTNLEVTHFPLDQLKVLKLAGNPLQCNCSLSWLWHLIQEQKSRYHNNITYDDDNDNDYYKSDELIIDLNDIRCAGPEQLVDILLVDATESQVDCSISWIAAISAILTTIFIIGIIIVVVYWRPIKTKTKKHDLTTNEQHYRNKNTSTCSNGRNENFDTIRTDKCTIGPPLAHHDYRTLAPWDTYSNGPTLNIYEQLDVNKKTRPHIVYV